MKFGFYAPNFDFCGDARLLAELAYEAEDAGWDGFFIWDHLQFTEPVADAWIALAAMAMRTQRIKLGPLVTPLPRRHIAKLAREIITLDHLSNGRLILGVGAGFPYLPDYAAFGDESDPRIRAAQLDEGLDILARLLSGAPVDHQGPHYRVECGAFQPTLQKPRVPIWVAAAWSSKRPLQRAAKWDGVVPVAKMGLEVQGEDFHSLVAYIAEHRRAAGAFDVVRFGRTKDPQDRAEVEESARAGATWWIDYIYAANSSLEETRARLRLGPPRL